MWYWIKLFFKSAKSLDKDISRVVDTRFYAKFVRLTIEINDMAFEDAEYDRKVANLKEQVRFNRGVLEQAESY